MAKIKRLLEGQEMKLGQIISKLVLVGIGLFSAFPINAQENKITIDSLWGSVKSESENLINKSIEVTSDFANELGLVIDGEIDDGSRSNSKYIGPSRLHGRG